MQNLTENQQNCIAILRECKNKWERRCSLTPREVKMLTEEQNIKVLVQPSTIRCYTDDEFEAAGAIIQEDVSSAEVLFGVKEVPIANLMPSKTYFFFSHTIKAQDYNMPLLDNLLEKKVRMIDFECIKKDNQRLVAFGRYAGIAGAYDFLRGVGEFLLEKGYQTPLVFLGSSYMYEDYDAMKDALSRIAKNVVKGGLPKVFSPMVFAVTGTGRVAQGIIEVLEQLPHEKVEPDNLEAYLKSCENDGQRTKKVVISQFASKDLVQLKAGDEPFDKAHYYKNPHLYESKFAKYLPFVSFLVNGIYWEPKYPRVLSTDELRLAHKNGKSALMGVCDISADAEGSVEFTRRFTSIEEPFLVYDTQKDEFYEKINQSNDNSILFHSVDHLPAEMPKEASNHFGEALFPFVAAVANSNFDDDFTSQLENLPTEITGATICCHGELTPKYSYIAELRKLNSKVNLDIQEIYEEMPDIDGAQIHSSSKQEAGVTVQAPVGGRLKRNLSLVNITLTGHLFDTKCFNQCIDICEEFSIQFRVVSWDIGNLGEEESAVSMQMMAKNAHQLDQAMAKLEAIADTCKISLSQVEASA